VSAFCEYDDDHPSSMKIQECRSIAYGFTFKGDPRLEFISWGVRDSAHLGLKIESSKLALGYNAM
jgi:hypothetical protein